MKIVSVFGSAGVQSGSEDYIAAEAMGSALAIAGYSVMTGGYSGIMEAVSKGASEAGGHVIGITTEQIKVVRPGATANQWVEEEIPYAKLENRLGHLVRHADAYVIMPGGLGTLTELALAWEYMRVDEIPVRPMICYGDLWQRTLETFMDDQYVSLKNQQMVDFVKTPAQVIKILKKNGI